MKPLGNSELNTFGLRVWGGRVDTMYPPHRHNEIEINALETGALTYMLAGQQTTVQPGEVALFWGAIPHQVIQYAPNTQLYWATIPLEYLLQWDLPRAFLLTILSGNLFRGVLPLYSLDFFRQWALDLERGEPTVALMEMRTLFFRAAAVLDFTTPMPNDPPIVEISDRRARDMALLMSRRFQEPLTVREIASAVALHPNYAMNIFKTAFGLSLIEYLTHQRVAHAQQLLIMKDMTIADIALESGFQTLSHFYTAFYRLVGISPGKYRASLRP